MKLLDEQNSKNRKFVIDKIFHPLDVHFWYELSISVVVLLLLSVCEGAPEKTEQAKKKDLSKFIQFFQSEVGHDLVDSWTPSASKQFQKNLLKTVYEKTCKPYKATSINRTMATIRHVAS